MPDATDHYREWLGIETSRRPLNSYELLGIPTFESRPEVIQEAADRQLARLQQVNKKANATLVKRIETELLSAKACLLDGAKKAVYDEAIIARSDPGSRSSPASPQLSNRSNEAKAAGQRHLRSKGSRSIAASANTSSDELLLAPLPELPPKPIWIPPVTTLRADEDDREDELDQRLKLAILGVCATCILITVVGLFLVFSETSDSQIPNDVASAVRPPDPAVVGKHNPVEPPAVTPVNTARAPVVRDTTATAPSTKSLPTYPAEAPSIRHVPAKVEQSPVPNTRQPSNTTAASTTAPPDAVDLPPIESPTTASTLLVPWNTEGAGSYTVDVLDVADDARNSPFSFFAKNSTDAQQVWHIHKEVPNVGGTRVFATVAPTIGDFALKPDGLHFRWARDARANNGDNLRNSILRITGPGKDYLVKLRKPVVSPAVVLALDREVITLPIPGGGLPPRQALRMQVLKTEGLPNNPAILPAPDVGFDEKHIRIVLNGQIGFVMQLTIESKPAGPVVAIAPLIIDSRGRTLPLTVDRIEGMRKTLPRETADSSRDLAKLNNTISAVIARGQATENIRVDNAGDLFTKQMELANINKELGRLQRQRGNLAERLATSQNRLRALPAIVELAKQLHEKAAISLRVYCRNEQGEIDLLRAE